MLSKSIWKVQSQTDYHECNSRGGYQKSGSQSRARATKRNRVSGCHDFRCSHANPQRMGEMRFSSIDAIYIIAHFFK